MGNRKFNDLETRVAPCNWVDFDLFHSKDKFGQICLVCLYQTNSQMSVYGTIGYLGYILIVRLSVLRKNILILNTMCECVSVCSLFAA